ncbi:MAG TPA: carbohydrate kinase family protein [Thermoguttaceae bacterium]|nr:carbohydrate kinase family protein [Thermoguttaceae bacterium]
MPKTIDGVVCGSCVADILVRPVRLDVAWGEGTLTQVDPIEPATGGIVCNSGIAMARLGLNVAALGCVGNDHWASMIRGRLTDEGIDARRLVTHPTAATTTAVVLIDSDGQRSFAFCPGATEQLSSALFLENLDLFAQSRMALIGYYSLLPNLEHDLPEVLAAIRERGCRTALDSAGNGGRMEPLDRILPHLDVYVPSYAEAAHQTGESEPRAILEAYRRSGARGLLGVKLGSQGAVLSPAAGEYVRIDPVPPPGPVVDTTGAGDCFYAGLLVGLLKGMSIRDAGRLAAACAALSITGKGATTAAGDYAATARLAGLAE